MSEEIDQADGEEQKVENSIASLGGKAAAAKMSAAERSERARAGASARWHKNVPIAEYEGEVDFAGVKVACAVLPDGTRVLSERGVTKGFGLKRAGSNWQRKETGARMPVFLSANNLKQFIPEDLRLALQSPVLYRPKSNPGAVAHGVRADLLPKVCDVWLKARDAARTGKKVLHAQQEHIAIQADLIMRGFAHVGIIALVDEATGFQEDRARNALAEILRKFVAQEIQDYVRAFPLRYFKGLCKLKNKVFSADMKLPRYFGHLTNDIIYRRLAPAVLDEIRRKNPAVNGRRKEKNYNWLTPDTGHPKLMQLLGSVCTLMEISDTWEGFKKLLDKVHPVYQPMPLYAGVLEDD